MKKTLKLVLIFAGGLVALVVGALTGFVLIDRNKTYYIYDVRFVEPVEGMSGYVYTDSEAEYVSIKNQSFYMSSEEKNYYPIAIYASTSTQTKNVKITSSDTNVAKIDYKSNACYVKFLNEGFVTITAEIDGVKDTLMFHVYDQIPSNFTVYDYDYYGEYAELFPNTLVSYADGSEYRYKFFMNNASDTGDNEHIDGDLLRIDQSNLDMDIFSNVYIDSETKELVVKCKIPETTHKENIDSVVILQSFYHADNGEIVLENDYLVKLHIVLYIPEFLEIEVSSTPNFDEKIVFLNVKKTDISSITSAEILEDPSLLDEYLSTEKAENYLSANGEAPTYNVFFTDRVERLYIRIRMVYTNGDIVYLHRGENGVDFTFSNESLCSIVKPTKEYYVMNVNYNNYFKADGVSSFDINLTIPEFAFAPEHLKFSFYYKDTKDDGNVIETGKRELVETFYLYDETTGIYTFNYWDDRARFANELYDAEGNVIGFGGWEL